MKTFVEVAQARSFTVAARRMGVSRATATKQVAALETILGARLLDRNSQFVSLTEAGSEMLEGSVRLLEDLEGLAENVASSTGAARGTIRIGVPPSFGANHLIRAIAAFLEVSPKINIQLVLDDGTSNLVREGIDVSIRIATSLQSTGEIAKLLGRVRQLLVASPAYIARHGKPRTPLDLSEHNCLVHALKSPSDVWTFIGTEGQMAVHVSGTIRSNFGDPLRTAALFGQGISIHPTYMVEQDIADGALVALLPDYEPLALDITAIYPQRRHLPARIRSFLDFTKDWLEGEGTFVIARDAS